MTPWFLIDKLHCRITINPGYNCKVECKHKIKGNHGMHGDEWHFDMRTELYAIRLTCYTCGILETGETWNYGDDQYTINGAWLHFHDGRKPTEPCDILSQGCSPGDVGCLIASELFQPVAPIIESYLMRKLTNEEFIAIGNQVEKLWFAMNDIFQSWMPQ